MTDSEPIEKPFFSVTVAAEHAGKRLDRFLVDAVADLSRARARTMIETGQVRVDRRRARKGDSVTAGMVIELLAPPPPKDFSPLPEPQVALVVRFDDPHIVVVDKPAGMPTHPLRPDETGTLANAIIARYPETADVGFARREPGLLHRLDTDTSGLVMVARDASAFETLREAGRSGRITKRYLAIVEGVVPTEARVDYPLVPHRKDPKRVEAVTPHVRLRAGTRTHEAHTRYRPLRALHAPDGTDYTLVEAEVSSAFRHQVRVHLATAGHPLLGDALYRGPMAPSAIALSRHFLHASEIVFPHPVTGADVRVTSPLPDELAAVLHRFSSR